MDDTQQTVQPTVSSQPTDAAMPSMNDVAGMTPPPAGMGGDLSSVGMTPPSAPEPTAPSMSSEPLSSTMPMQEPAAGSRDEYATAEDILSEILDSLDRIEAKLEAMEKKQG